MQAIRIIAWTVLLAAVLLFSYGNWTRVEVLIWDGIVLETKVPALMLLSFLLGFLPMWLVNHGTRWRLRRRIRSLETAAQPTGFSSATPLDAPLETIENKPETP